MNKIYFVILLFLLTASSCRKDMIHQEFGDKNSVKKILVTGTPTQYKESVIQNLIKKLGTTEYYFDLKPIKQLSKEDLSQYGVILIVDTLMAGKLDQNIVTFLGKKGYQSKTVVFFTRGGEVPGSNWPYPEIQVDAITSPSVDSVSNEKVEQLVHLIQAKF